VSQGILNLIVAIHEYGVIDQLSNFLGSLGVLTTGLAAITSAILSKRSERKRAGDECDRRIAELGEAYQAGIKLADQRPKVRKGHRPHAD